MYLSKLVLNPRSSWVQRDYADRYRMHRTVYSGFAAVLPESERVLFRVEQSRDGAVMVLVQSHDAPTWSESEQINRAGYLLCPVEEKRFELQIPNDARFQFRLTANPTVKRDGKRWALRKEDEQMAWLERKSAEHGFAVEALSVIREGDITGLRDQQRLVWHSARFEGVLRVIDSGVFVTAIGSGIGAAKSFGFGLLSIMPPRG